MSPHCQKTCQSCNALFLEWIRTWKDQRSGLIFTIAFLVSVTRAYPTRCELYGFSVRQRLPKINLPLASDDNDLPLDLQQVFHRCWSTGPYPELLNYDQSPPGTLSEEDLAFCRSIAQAS